MPIEQALCKPQDSGGNWVLEGRKGKPLPCVRICLYEDEPQPISAWEESNIVDFLTDPLVFEE